MSYRNENRKEVNDMHGLNSLYRSFESTVTLPTNLN